MNSKKLNIFDSGFSIHAELKTKEKKWQEHWKKIQLVCQIQNRKKPKKVFLSGPPYANGDIHIGHALNKILKDFVLRFYAFQGYAVEYKPGWDMHGLPIATEIIKRNPELMKSKNVQFRDACLKYGMNQVKKQTEQFERLGLLIDFKNRYLSSDPEYIVHQLKIFSNFVKKGLVQRSLKPVFWSWSSETALAETEIIYQNVNNNSLFFLFPIQHSSNLPDFVNSFFVVWTTAIWTIPENKLLAIDQNQEYVQVKWNNKKIIISQSAYKKYEIFKNLKILNTISGKRLLKITYRHCYLQNESIVVHSDHVKQSAGTGIVHIAPAFGIDDFALAKKHKIDFEVAINEKGFFNQSANDKNLVNVFYKKSEPQIIEQIKQNSHFFQESTIEHSYPFDWRTKKPVFYRATSQWYLVQLPQKSHLINKWEPKWGKKRINDSLAARNEWCISRQRTWGVPIPAFQTNDGKIILNNELIDVVIEKIKKFKTDQIWWTEKLDNLIHKTLIDKYQIKNRVFETMDVWFDSGIAAEYNYFQNNQKIDFIWEGNDQFRGWYSSLSILSLSAPTLNIGKALIHGFVNDEKGFKMSKSEKNTIDPNEVCSQFGADIIRMWVVNSDYYGDIKFGPNIIKTITQMYLKTRNTIRFLINNLVDFIPEKHHQKNLTDLDLLILSDFDELIKSYTENFSQQQFHQAWINFFKFLNLDLSNFYFDFAKGFIYSCSSEDLRRRQIQTVFSILLEKIIILIAPIIPHTTEEAYTFIKFDKGRKKLSSIHLEQWPKQTFDTHFVNSRTKKYLNKYKNFLQNLKEEFSKILDQKKKNKEIKRSQELSISIEINSETYSDLDFDKEFLVDFLKIHSLKKINLVQKNKPFIFFTEIENLQGTICPRCYRLIQKTNKILCNQCHVQTT